MNGIQIAVVIEDKEFVDSLMGGDPWNAGKFSFSLRLSLWAEHLGLNPEEVVSINSSKYETRLASINHKYESISFHNHVCRYLVALTKYPISG